MADNVKIKIEVDAKQGVQDINELKNSLKETGDVAGSSKGKLGGFGGALNSLGGPIKVAIDGFKALGKQLWALVANPIVAIIAGIVLAFMGLWKILKSFQPVIDLMEQGLAGLQAIFQVIKNTIYALVTGTTNLRDAFSGLGGRMKQAAVDAANLKKAMQDLEDSTKNVEVANAKLQTQINELLLQSKDRTKTEEERMALMDKAMKLEEEQYNNSKSLNDQAVANAEETIRIKSELNAEELAMLKEKGVEYANQLADEGRLTDEEVDKLKEALVQRESINQQHIALKEKTQNRINATVDAAAEKEKKIIEDANVAKEKALEEEAKRVEEEKKLLAEKDAAVTQSIMDDLKAETVRLQLAGATDKEIFDSKIRTIEAEQALYEENSLKWLELQLQKQTLNQEFNDKEVADAKKKYDELNKLQEQAILDDLAGETIKLEMAGATDQEIYDSKVAQLNAQQSLYEEGSLKWLELEQQKANLKKDFDAKELQAEEEKKQKKIAIAQAVFAGVSQIMSSLGAFYDAQMNKELEAAGENEAEKEKIRKEYAKKKKRMAYVQAIIDTASAVMQALSSMPPPISYIMAAVSAAAGAIQIATISQQQFAQGGILTGPSHANGGIMTPFGEVEGGEGVINKNSMANPDLRNLASAVNVAGGGSNFGTGDGSIRLSSYSIQMIADAINNKKVYVVESDITETQNKVKVMENAAFL